MAAKQERVIIFQILFIVFSSVVACFEELEEEEEKEEEEEEKVLLPVLRRPIMEISEISAVEINNVICFHR